eukprot:s435_g14.t1
MGSGSSARQKAYAQGKDVPKSENSGILATRPAEDPTELIIHAISGGSQKTLAEKKKKKQEKQATLLAMDCNAPTLQRPSSARSRHSGEPRELLIPTVKSGASLEPPQSRHSQRSNRSLSSGSEEEEEVRNRQIFSRVHTDTSRQYLRKHYTRRQSDPGSPTGEDSVEAQAEILNRRCSAGDVRRQEAPKSRPGSKQSNLRPGSKQHPSRQGSKESNQLSTQDKLPNGVWSATIQEGSGKKQKTRREERRPCSASHEGTVNGFVKPPKVEWTENYSWGSMLVKLKFHRTEPWLLEGHFETSDATQGKITLLHERLKSLVHYYDPLGRFVCMRNSMIERVGVVRSLLPSQFGPWWELDVTFLARQDSPSQLILLLPVGPSGDALASLEAWAGFQKEPSSVVRGAIVGPSDGVRDRPRKFPHPGHGIQEWAEAAISSGADDSVSMFFEGASSDDEVEESSFVTCLGCHMSKSVEELLAQLDRDEAREWEALRPSTRVEVGGGSVPSIEERSECGVSVLSRGNRPRAVAANFTGDSRSSKKQDRRSKLNLLRSDLEARVDTQISARFREQPAPGREMESKLRSLRLDLEGKVVTISEGKIQSLEDRLESRMVKSRVDLEETLESFIGDRLESLRKECHEDAKGYCQDVQARLSDDLVAMQQRLVSELRAETTLALNRESAAIAALDEQLWITDQRLGQRIDDLEQVRVRERGSVKNGRVLSSILSETLEETRDLEMEPTTHEAADRRAKRVSKGVLADAQLAARSMMEECRTDDVRGGGLLPRRGREVTTSTRLRSFEDEGLGRLRSTRLGTGGALGMASKAAEPFASRARYD